MVSERMFTIGPLIHRMPEETSGWLMGGLLITPVVAVEYELGLDGKTD